MNYADEFTLVRDKLIENFKQLTNDVKILFEVDLDKDELWNIYLDSFPAGMNEIYRERREFDCSCCRHFVKAIGNAVVIKDNKVHTIWDFDTGNSKFQPVFNAMDAYVKSHAVTDVYINKLNRVGTMKNFEEVVGGQNLVWTHFYLDMPRKFIDTSGRSVGDIQGDYRDTRNVFKRSLDEISMEAVDTVLELIAQNSLYKGAEWKGVLTEFRKYKEAYENIPREDRDNFAWEKSIAAGPAIGRIRNHSMGTLLTNISEGMDLDTAVRKYEQIVAPANYKRSNAVFTKRMLEDAKKTLTDLGYMDSLPRRFAKVDDITVNNILFCNKDTASKIGADDIFANMEKEISVNPKKFSKVEEIGIDKFISDVLPTATDIELLLENKHAGNMVSLIAPVNKDSKTMFKWDNNFGWAYTGNVTDSMKERVKAAGGKVDGDLRFSIQWNDGEGHDGNDLDAHCIEPDKFEIFFGSAKKPRFSPTKGQLDVDVINPSRNIPAVENITWANRSTMKKGKYYFFVHCYSYRYGKSGFRAEIEFDGHIYSFDYNKEIRKGQKIPVAEVTLNADNTFSIKELLPSTTSSKKIWNVNTNQFIPVSVICYSPNYWNQQEGIGHKHVFFMLKDCVNPETPNGMFNEYLKEELYQKHRKVFEALGSKMAVSPSDDQLSGVGFSTTKRGDVIVKVKGATERIIKIKF